MTTTFIELDRASLEVKSNVRKDLGDLTDLAASIAQQGIVQPLIVEANGLDDHYFVVAGHRRLAAYDLTKATFKIPAVVRQYGETDRLVVQIIENVQRKDMNPIEEADGYHALGEEMGLTQAEVAEKVGKDQSYISRRLSLRGLPEAAQRMVIRGEIVLRDAFELARITDAEVVHHILESGVSTWKIDNAVMAQERDAITVRAADAARKKGLPMADDDERRLLTPTGEFFKSLSEAKKYTFGEEERLWVQLDHNDKPNYLVMEPRLTRDLGHKDEAIAEKAARTYERKVSREVHNRWVQALVPVVAKPRKQLMTRWILISYVSSQLYTYAKQVVELLDLEPVVKQVTTGYGDEAKVSNQKDYPATAQAWADVNETQLWQVAQALVIIQAKESYGHAELADEVEGWLASLEVPSKMDIQAEVAVEFAEAQAEADEKKRLRDEKRAAKEAEAAAAEAPTPEAETPENQPEE